MKSMVKFIAVVCTSLMLVFSVGCSSTKTSESTGQYVDNTAITTKVKAKLFDQLGPKSFSINVKSFKDNVQLSGFVDSEKTKQAAGNIAQSVSDVKQVENNLIVKKNVDE